jgi:hypothetical protein
MRCINNKKKKCTCNKVTCNNEYYNKSDYIIWFKQYEQSWDVE